MMHTIQAGESLWSIASRFGVSVQALAAANPGIDPRLIYIGQCVWIPCAHTTIDASVSVGDSAWQERLAGLERTIGQLEEILGHHRRQIAELHRRLAAIEQCPG